MKLAAIYNIWDGLDILPYSIANMIPLVDDIIIVWSRYSNKGNRGEFNPQQFKYNLVNFEPDPSRPPHDNERAKRNAGLEHARQLGFTHFIMMDCDEFYDPAEFKREKQRIIELKPTGTVCAIRIYFGKPNLTIGLDPTTRVPFIHRIHTNLRFKPNRHYPFAYDKNGGCRIDPTRQMNINSGVLWADIIMDHYSWVRKDITSKVENSSANLSRSSCREDFKNAQEGYFCKMYQRTLQKCNNKYGIRL